MKGGIGTSGFTIIETMIVLAVTGLIAISAFLAVNGRTNQTEFTTAINDIRAEIQKIISNAANGYYLNSNDFTCSAGTTGAPIITSGAGTGTGTNANCTLLGNAIQFDPGGGAANNGSYNVYTLLGRQCIPTESTGTTGTTSVCTTPSTYAENCTTGTDACPQALAPGTSVQTASYPNTDMTTARLENGLTEISMYYYQGSTKTSTSLASFIANASSANVASTTQTGTESLSVFVIPSASNTSFGYGTPWQSVVQQLDNTGLTQVNSVTICFLSGTTSQYGLITIGNSGSNSVNGSPQSVQLTISDATCQ